MHVLFFPVHGPHVRCSTFDYLAFFGLLASTTAAEWGVRRVAFKSFFQECPPTEGQHGSPTTPTASSAHHSLISASGLSASKAFIQARQRSRER